MSTTKWILPVLCLTGTLSAQALGDLNGLITSASHYVSHGLGGGAHTTPLELCKIAGDSGDQEGTLMNRSVDVQHWRFLYRIDVGKDATLADAPEPEAKRPAPIPKHHSVTADCTKGVFSGFKYSPAIVTDAKTLENTWIGVPLEDAIDQLKANGYVRGFTKVLLARPANPALPDDYVYIFNCPVEHTQVAISTQTGALAWTVSY